MIVMIHLMMMNYYHHHHHHHHHHYRYIIIITVLNVEYRKNSDNMAAGKMTSSSSVYGFRSSDVVVDGSPQNNWFGGSCFSTALNDLSPWWRVEVSPMYVDAVLILYPVENDSKITFNSGRSKGAGEGRGGWWLHLTHLPNICCHRLHIIDPPPSSSPPIPVPTQNV